MDLSSISSQLNEIELNQFGLNKILINLILQIFIKNNIDDPNDIMVSISEYLDIDIGSSIINNLASQLNIMFSHNNWVWVQ